MTDQTPIQPVEVVRDTEGHWTHPAWPETDDEYIPKTWFTEHGLELSWVEFEYDAAEELQQSYFDGGAPDVSAWEPTMPVGDGWFIFSIHDTEDGPICVWVRPIQQHSQPEEPPCASTSTARN